ncbi:MAG: helix-turn-helix transcriptional regulator [Clostridium sp.]|nr:helix-turn-helix transcriptional regulator [Clostridium sp.]
MNEKFDKYAKILKALSDQNRLKIISILSCEEQCGCEILNHFDFTQPTLSHHMKVLMDCGLVISRKEGTWCRYKLNCENSKELLQLLYEIMNNNNNNINNCNCD